jgi:predicted adenine nucleotide alpha hydrolase (AANH) superfamily ATPase
MFWPIFTIIGKWAARMSKVLIHICCAHCGAYTAEYWRQQGHEVTGFWYNPNVHPYMEHQNRLEAVKKLAEKISLPLIIQEGYDMPQFLRQVASNYTERCGDCFNIRLGKTAGAARANGFNAFTTTLLISPHQKHELIKEAGERAARETFSAGSGGAGVEFLYADLRKRYSDSRHITKPMELYRQQYCGCIYSEWERYTEENTKS